MESEVPEGQADQERPGGHGRVCRPVGGYGNLVLVDHGARAYSPDGYLGVLGVNNGQRLDAQAAVGTV